MVRITIRITDKMQEILDFHTRNSNILSDNKSKQITEVFYSMHSHILSLEQQLEELKKNPVEPSSCQIPTINQQLELLKGWDCTFRFPVWRYHKPTRKWQRKVLCFNPKTREIVKTNELDIEVCKRCHDEGGGTKSIALPEPKKTPKPVKEQREKKKCLTTGCENEIWDGTHCRPCFDKLRSKLRNKEYPNGLPGSSMFLRKKEAEAIRRANSRMNGNMPIGTLDELTKSELQQEVEADVRTHWSEWYKERGIDIDSKKSKDE